MCSSDLRNVIQQTVVLPAPAEKLFSTYLDPAGHAAVTGGPVVVRDTPGSEFRAFDGMLSGAILAVVKPRLIIQLWRSVAFRPGDVDSTLILTFSPDEGGGRIDLVHLDVPDHDLEGVRSGWVTHYWAPWRQLLEKHSRPMADEPGATP